MKPDYLMIGEITKPQGVRGELKVRPVTADPYRFEGMTEAYVLREGRYERVELSVNRVAADAAFLNIRGVESRDEAEKLRGVFLYVPRSQAIALSEDENFLCDLVGLKGVDDEGRAVGTLKEVLQPGGVDVYVFAGPRGDVLVPALKSVVQRVDLDAGIMTLVAARMAEVAVYQDED
jgi:16S rRNA processing protein RimM